MLSIMAFHTALLQCVEKRSTISISLPEEQPEPEEIFSNVIRFPPEPRAFGLEDIPDMSELSGITLTPLQLLGLILKVALKDRITDDEIDKICSVYYEWGTKIY